MLRTAAALGILLCITASAQAEEQETTNLRFGIGVAEYTLDVDDLDSKFKPTGFEVFAGYEFNRYLALEAGYLSTGDDSKNFEGIVEIDAKANAWFASAVVSVPLRGVVSLYGRAGLLRFERTASLSGPAVDAGLVIDRDVAKGEDPYYGIGVSATVDGALLRLEYRLADIDQVDVSALGINVAWRF